MARLMMTFGLIASLIGISGCTGDVAKKPTATAPVAGTVQLDGKPMDEAQGEITFAMTGEAPVNIPIKAGKFEGTAPVGDGRVEIRAYRAGKPMMMNGTAVGEPVKENYIPPKFNSDSTMMAKIATGGTKDLKFDVTSQ
jgi:hypothetical protein